MVRVVAKENFKREEQIRTLIEKSKVVLIGDTLMMDNPMSGEGRSKPIGMFGLNPEDSQIDGPKVWFCTPHGVPMFEADDLHKFALEVMKKNFLKHLDTLLNNQVALAKSVTL